MLPQISQPGLSYERLHLLLDVNNAVVTHLDLHDLLHAISETLHAFVPHDFTALAIYDEETKELRAHAIEAAGERGLVAEGTPLALEGTFAGVAITKRETIRRDKIDFEEFHHPMIGRAVERLELKSHRRILEQTRGVIGGKGGAAEILGLPMSTLRNRMKKLGLR